MNDPLPDYEAAEITAIITILCLTGMAGIVLAAVGVAVMRWVG